MPAWPPNRDPLATGLPPGASGRNGAVDSLAAVLRLRQSLRQLAPEPTSPSTRTGGMRTEVGRSPSAERPPNTESLREGESPLSRVPSRD